MTFIMNPFEMGSEISNSSDANFPNFILAKYMVLKIVPPKGKTVRDGLVLTAAMLSFTHEGKEQKTVAINEGPSGYEISFPLGKKGLLATKYRGPKSQYKFVNPATNKFYQIPNEKFTVEYAEKFLAQSVEGWDKLPEADKENHIDEYLENMYMFGLSNDLALDNSEQIIIPRPGMVTNFYRRYTPPVGDEKYGNIIITKWPKKSVEVESTFNSLDGEHKIVDEAIAVAIQDAISEHAKPVFNPSTYDPTYDVADGDDEIPF